MSNGANNFVDSITESPEGQLQLALLEAGLSRHFDEAAYEKYLGQIAANDPDPILAAEIGRARNATYNQTPQISLTTTSRQLLWAATSLRLAAIAANDKKNFSDTAFFRHFVNQPVYQQELLRYAQTLSDHFDH